MLKIKGKNMENTEAQETEKKAEGETEAESTESTDATLEAEATETDSGDNKKEEDAYKEKYLYLAAEMENMRRRFDREKSNLLKFGNEKILTSLVEVVDNLDRTVEALEKDEDEKVKNIVIGINMVRAQFKNVLKSNGLEEVECLGKMFDPNFHEAMTQQEVEGKEANEIIQVFEKGYVLNGRLMRAAKVIVSK